MIWTLRQSLKVHQKRKEEIAKLSVHHLSAFPPSPMVTGHQLKDRGYKRAKLVFSAGSPGLRVELRLRRVETDQVRRVGHLNRIPSGTIMSLFLGHEIILI